MDLAMLYLITGGTLLVADVAWLGVVAGGLLRAEVGHPMGLGFSPAPATAFYALYSLGILVFAVRPGLQGDRLTRGLLLGSGLGLVAYTAFHLTSLAFADIPLGLALLDIAWGTLVTAFAAAVGVQIGRGLGLGA